MKTVSFDDEAYDLLRGAKLSRRDSFSDVVKRHFGRRGRLADSAGGWSGVSDARARAMREETVEAFGTTGD